jgi:Flp pilus assembly protein TadD
MVEQGVALITSLLKKPAGETASHPIGPAGSEQVNFSVPVQYDDFTNLLFISHLYIQAGREAEAIKAANQAYEVGGSDERRQIAKTTLASAQQMAGDYAGAEATLRGILKQTPRNPIALNNLGYFLVERNERIAEALDMIQQAVKIDPTNPSYLDSRGWAHFALGNLEEAERDLKLASRIDSSSETIHEHLGDVYGKQGKVTQARLSWERALELATNADDIKRIKGKLQK